MFCGPRDFYFFFNSKNLVWHVLQILRKIKKQINSTFCFELTSFMSYLKYHIIDAAFDSVF